MTDLGYNIPKSILKPASGLCVECGLKTEDRHIGDWMCDDCNDRLNQGQEQDHRLDSPAHTPYRNLRGGK